MDVWLFYDFNSTPARHYLTFLGLASEYQNRESKIGKFLRLFFGLYYLKSFHVRDLSVFELFNII
jgi:hypothetical protein